MCSVQLCTVLQQTCRKESLSLPLELARRIAEKSSRNMRRALLLCEACRVQQYVYMYLSHTSLLESLILLCITCSLYIRVDVYMCVCVCVIEFLHYRYPFSEDQTIPECDWEVFLRETAAMIIEQQSPQRFVL